MQDLHILLPKRMQQTVYCAFLWTQMKYESDGGGIRTHDDADERRTLSEHGYGRSDMKWCIFHGNKEEPSYLVLSRGKRDSI